MNSSIVFSVYPIIVDCDQVWSECRVLTKEGIAFNVNECLVKTTIQGTTTEAHVRATCFNNCKGKKLGQRLTTA